jgi:hypothetical protein
MVVVVACAFGHGIVPSRVEGMTPRDALECHPAPAKHAKPLDRC